MPSFIPEVNPKSEFREIANDFGNPLEIIREAISNSYDAHASEMDIFVYVDRTSGIDELILKFNDNGDGISEEGLKKFFGLGYSSRLQFDQLGNKTSDSIGEKGHGTKIYYNSRKVILETIKDGIKIEATLDNPMQKLRSQNDVMPEVEYNISNATDANGTTITVYGYNSNIQAGFSHNEIVDYIYWFTKYGSFESQLPSFTKKLLNLKVMGLGENELHCLKYSSHPFPKENFNISELKKIDKVAPLEYYVAKWDFEHVQVIDHPNSFVDIVFYIEGDKAKREYNNMIHEKHGSWNGGVYNVEQRYGLWLCKDFIPIERHNEWVAEKSEWTKYHSFVNCQDIKLTANRGDAGNTNAKLLKSIGDTVRSIFLDKIEKDEKFKKYQDEFAKYKQYSSVKKEEEDFSRRKKIALQKKAALFSDIIIFEPRQEGGVFSLVTQLLTIDPNIFKFKVIDYDTSFGYDLLVTKNTAHDLQQAAMYFVEMKFILKKDFNHSFKKLSAIICWDTDLNDEYVLEDIAGEIRKMRITPAGVNNNEYTKYMIVSDTEDHNIEVFVLRKYLKEVLDLTFVPRAEINSTRDLQNV